MRIGDSLETAVWVTGNESIEMRQRFERDIREYFAEISRYHGVVHGPVIFIEKRPGDDRVPQVPEHIQGPAVRLIVAESIVIAEIPISSKGSFVANLEVKDLHRLRDLTRKIYAKKYPGNTLNNQECDEIIEEMGPDAALESLRVIH